MKLVSFVNNLKPKVGIFSGKKIVEINCSMIEALSCTNIDEMEKLNSYNIEDVKICSPVKPSKIVCVGLNYTDHAKELGMELPSEPVIFIKPSTAMIGHLDTILYPGSSSQVDYEAELGIVISKEAYHVSGDDASDFIGGYTIVNDVTARDKQRKDVQWTRAKSYDTFAPVGPCIETVMDPLDQMISLRLNNELKQSSNTKNMIFKVNELVEFISSIMTLLPGTLLQLAHHQEWGQ